MRRKKKNKDRSKIRYQKTLKIPFHWNTTQEKLNKLNRLTARFTYAIKLISDLIKQNDVLNIHDSKEGVRETRRIVKENKTKEITGLSAGFVDQCIDKALWMWESYRKLHEDWEYKIKKAEEKGNDKWLQKLLRGEPSEPFTSKKQHKISPRIDVRTGSIKWSEKTKLTPLWLQLSTLKLREPISVPLNPTKYHINQLRDAEINDFEIIKKDGKFFAHITITKEVEAKKVSSVGGIDQGLNRSIAAVLLKEPMPCEELIMDVERKEQLDKYETLMAGLQRKKLWKKLRELEHKRRNVSIYHDWMLANKVAEITNSHRLGIGNSRFRQTQYRGNHMPKLRKRICKWPYSRQRKFIALKRAEKGLPTILKDEKSTSKICHLCGSMMTQRKWLNGCSYILCWGCGAKLDADLNAAHNIALRCRDDWLKERMNWVENSMSVQDRCPSFQ